MMCEKKRSGGYEAGGLRRRGRVTAWSQARRRGQRQLHDAGDARGALSPFVTPGRPSSAKKKMLLPFPAPASILTAFIYPHPLLFSISYVITAAASPPPITRLFLSPLPITLLLFYIHPYDSVLLIP